MTAAFHSFYYNRIHAGLLCTQSRAQVWYNGKDQDFLFMQLLYGIGTRLASAKADKAWFKL